MESDLEDFDEDSMDTLYTEEDEEHMEWSESPEYLLSLFSNLESTWEVMGYYKFKSWVEHDGFTIKLQWAC